MGILAYEVRLCHRMIVIVLSGRAEHIVVGICHTRHRGISPWVGNIALLLIGRIVDSIAYNNRVAKSVLNGSRERTVLSVIGTLCGHYHTLAVDCHLCVGILAVSWMRTCKSVCDKERLGLWIALVHLAHILPDTRVVECSKVYVAVLVETWPYRGLPTLLGLMV